MPKRSEEFPPSNFPPEEFAARRQRLVDRIDPGAAVLLAGAGLPARFESFRQFNDFHYLSGVEILGSYLLVRAPSSTTTLYLPPHDERAARNEGESLSLDDPAEVVRTTGVDAVEPVAQLVNDLARLAVLHFVQAPTEGRFISREVAQRAAELESADLWRDRPSPEDHLEQLLTRRFPEMVVHDLTPALDNLRLVKSPGEIDVLRNAGRLSARAVIEAMRTTQVGAYERQLTAVADYIFRVNGAEGQAYAPIIASGENMWHAHWNRGTGRLADGDLVLMDCAPDLGYYTSDIGRLWPVNGIFAGWQRELYSYILAYHEALLRLLRPGVTPAAVLAEAASEMQVVFDETEFSKPAFREAARRTLGSDVHLSHPVGMAVHDVGDYRGRPLERGTVFAVDPQLWVPEERVYIRVEDTVVITDGGVEVLTDEAPRDIAVIEALVQGRGMLQEIIHR